MRTILSSAAVICLTLARFTTEASAATITLDATSRGWYNESGQALGSTNGLPTANYAAGSTDSTGTLHQYRNFFVFDLPSLTEVIVSATLRLTPKNYLSADASETYELYDVTTALASLTDRTGGLAAFADLGSGTSYGSRAFSAADAGNVPVTVTIALNGAALANLQAAAGTRVGLGGAVTSISGIAEQLLFPATDLGAISQLVLETAPAPPPPPPAVPEPATLALLGTGLVALASRWRRTRR